MPYYVYTCEECKAHFDVRATIAEKVAGLQPACPACRSRAVRQLMTAIPVLSGGTGREPPAGGGCCGPGSRCGCG